MNDSETVDLAVTGRILSDTDGWERQEILIRDGTITSITPDIGSTPALQRLDVGNAWVLPGMVDAHVHCLSETGEGIAAATRSAAAGGVTTIVEMPFDAAGPINSADRLDRKIDLARSEAHVDIALLGTVLPENGWAVIEPMVEMGACGFKVSTFNTDSVRFPRSSETQLRPIMAAIAAAGTTVCVHAEHNDIIQELLARPDFQASEDPGVHARSRPAIAETLGALSALETANEAGARLHLCHLSTPRAVDLAAWYRDNGTDVTIETCPHYLMFDESDVKRQHGRLKINPPIRDGAAREGLWQSVGNGSVDVIASDHAPWSADRKDHQLMLKNHSGAPGVETGYPTVLAEAVTRGDGVLARAIRAMTSAPADRYGIGHRKGRLAPGYDADLAVFDPTVEWTIDETRLHSNAGWSPFNGRTQRGRIVRTLVRGSVVWDGTDVVGAAGSGEFVSSRTRSG